MGFEMWGALLPQSPPVQQEKENGNAEDGVLPCPREVLLHAIPSGSCQILWQTWEQGILKQ